MSTKASRALDASQALAAVMDGFGGDRQLRRLILSDLVARHLAEEYPQARQDEALGAIVLHALKLATGHASQLRRRERRAELALARKAAKPSAD